MSSPSSSPAGAFSVSTFNVHWGGRLPGGHDEYDLAAACGQLDADVRVFQEVWGCPEEPSRLWVPAGFDVHELPMVRCPRPARFELPSPLAERVGDFSIVLATRFGLLERRVLELPVTPSDPRHHALACRLDTPLGPVWVVALHLTIGRLPLGSARQLRALARLAPTDGPVVLIGDHNLWRPPARAILGRRWTPAVKGKTWQSHRPRHQIDHIWVRGLGAAHGRVLPDLGSDHLAITATVTPAKNFPRTPQVLRSGADQ